MGFKGETILHDLDETRDLMAAVVDDPDNEPITLIWANTNEEVRMLTLGIEEEDLGASLEEIGALLKTGETLN